jgi:predicted GNAT family acetyltransferase
MSDSAIHENREKKRYETTVNDITAHLDYMVAGSSRALVHTEVPSALGGQGIGSALAKFALEDARANDRRVIVTCPFVIAYLQRHPEYMDVVLGKRG